MLTLSPELPADVEAIRRVHEAAFPTSAEADLVDRLRSVPDTLGLVASLDGTVVGHILFSRMHMRPPAPGLTLVGLAPMAVAPDRQRRGIGSALVRAGLDACREAGVDAVFVLGHPDYYPRFGFTPAADIGIASEYDVPREVFCALALRPHALDDVSGVACYAPPFSALDASEPTV